MINSKKNYEKYHSLNNPQEFLNRYLLLSAKDSPAKDTNKNLRSQVAETELKAKASALQSALEHATLMDVQEALMESVDTGNEAMVAKKFSNYDVGLMDPEMEICYLWVMIKL